MNGCTNPQTSHRLAGVAGLLAAVLTTAEAQAATNLGRGPSDLLRKGWPLLVIAGSLLLVVLVRNAARAAAAKEAERWRSRALTLGGTLLTRNPRSAQPAGLRLEIGEWTAVVDEKAEGGEGGSFTFVRFRIPYTATCPFLLILCRFGPLNGLLRSPLIQQRMARGSGKEGASPLAMAEVDGGFTMLTSDQPLAQEILADTAVRHLLGSLREAGWANMTLLPQESASDSARLPRLLTMIREGALPNVGGTWLLELSVEADKASPERLRAAGDLLDLLMNRLRERGVVAKGGAPSGVELRPE